MALVVAVSIYVYFYNAYEISRDPSVWGQFGDYLGGVLNPIVGLLGVLGLLWTIYQNQKELSESSKQLGISAQALKEQRDISERQEKRLCRAEQRQELLKAMIVVVDGIEADWSRDSVRKIDNTPAPLFDHISVLTLENQRSKLQGGLAREIAVKTSIQLNVLVTLLTEYHEADGSHGMQRAVLSRVMRIAEIVFAGGHMSPDAEIFFREKGMV